MRRLFRLSGRCLSHEEPLLLVGETGCGKTTVCQLYSMLLQRRCVGSNYGDTIVGCRLPANILKKVFYERDPASPTFSIGVNREDHTFLFMKFFLK